MDKYVLEYHTADEFFGLPEIVYKYRDWSNKNHKTIITNLEIHFDNPYESAGIRKTN